MNSDWKENNLGDLVNIQTGKLNMNASENGGKYPFFTCAPNISRINEFKYDTEAVLLGGNNAVGKFPIFYYHGKFNAYQRTYIIESKSTEVLDNKFLYYTLTAGLPIFREFAVGSATKFLTMPILENFKVLLPPIKTQLKIAHILRTIDGKIELNNRINQTLELTARAIFKSWFVDFDPVKAKAEAIEKGEDPELAAMKVISGKEEHELAKLPTEELNTIKIITKSFSSEYQNSRLGEIPKGWHVEFIDNMVNSISEKYPLKTVPEVIFLNTGDILDGQFLHENYSSTEGLPGQAKKSIKMGDILFSEIRPKNKRFAYVHFDSSDYVVSTKLMVLRTVEPYSPLFVYFMLKQDSTIDTLQMAAESRSGTFPQITFKELNYIEVALPKDLSLINYFTENILQNYFEKSFQITEESKALTQLRDTLLPKLLSGELTLPTAKAQIEEATA